MNKYIVAMRDLGSNDRTMVYWRKNIEAPSAEDALFIAKNNDQTAPRPKDYYENERFAFDIYCVENEPKHPMKRERPDFDTKLLP